MNTLELFIIIFLVIVFIYLICVLTEEILGYKYLPEDSTIGKSFLRIIKETNLSNNSFVYYIQYRTPILKCWKYYMYSPGIDIITPKPFYSYEDACKEIDRLLEYKETPTIKKEIIKTFNI